MITSKYWETEETDLGTKITLKQGSHYSKVSNPIFFTVKRRFLIGKLFVPFSRFKVSFGLTEEDNKYFDNLYDVSRELEEVDPDNFAIPYPCVGILKVNFTKGLVFKFNNEDDKQELLNKMDKALELYLERHCSN